MTKVFTNRKGQTLSHIINKTNIKEALKDESGTIPYKWLDLRNLYIDTNDVYNAITLKDSDNNDITHYLDILASMGMKCLFRKDIADELKSAFPRRTWENYYYSKSTTSNKIATIVAEKKYKQLLPTVDGHKLIQYIYNTNKSYNGNANINPKVSLKTQGQDIKIVFELNGVFQPSGGTSVSDATCLLSYGDNTGQNYIHIAITKNYILGTKSKYGISITEQQLSLNVKYTLEIKNGYVYLNDTNIGTWGTSSVTFNGWCIFAKNGYETSKYVIGKIYEVTISENGQVVSSIIPTVNLETNKAEYYDLVTGDIYISDNYLAGPDV